MMQAADLRTRLPHQTAAVITLEATDFLSAIPWRDIVLLYIGPHPSDLFREHREHVDATASAASFAIGIRIVAIEHDGGLCVE